MKMVSQLTRQAMSRHRLLSAVPHPEQQAASTFSHQIISADNAATPKTAPLPALMQTLPVSPAVSEPPRAAAAPAFPLRTPPQQTIYGQLMKKHDRFTERHLTRN